MNCQGLRLKQQDGTESMKDSNSPGLEARRESEMRQKAAHIDRAQRHELHIPLRFRLEGRQEWAAGEAINMSESGVLFSSDDLLEVDSRVQITFQSAELPMMQTGTRLVRIVRRMLSNWPETRVLFGAKFCN
jgi:hypothetical protein